MRPEHIDDRALALVALDDSDEEKREAIAHARACVPCARELERAKNILSFIDALPAPAPPSAEVLRRVSTSVALDLSGRRRLAFAIAGAFSANRLKAWYLSGAVVVQSLLATHAAVMIGTSLAHGEPFVAWGGALVGVAAMPARVVSYYLRPTPRTSARMLGLLALTFLACAGVIAASPSSAVPLGYGLIGLASSLYYVFGYSRFGRKESASLAVGNELPSFELSEYDGRAVDSRRYIGSPVVFMFIRGNWCPLCMAQIRELAARYRELDRLGAKVVLCSPQPRRKMRELSRHLDVPFDFLVDDDARAARALGILHPGGLPVGLEVFGYEQNTVLPTVVIADREGRIIFSDQTDNYRLRPEPETFLAALHGI
jgi:peroxiredoxin